MSLHTDQANGLPLYPHSQHRNKFDMYATIFHYGAQMFSTQQKHKIAEAVQKILRETGHPELPAGEIQFSLHVVGAEDWSWADIQNNGAVTNFVSNPWNERKL